MRDSLVAPSTPNKTEPSNPISEKKPKKSFLGKLFAKKAEKVKENKKDPIIPIKKPEPTKEKFLEQIEKEHFDKPKQDLHALDHLNQIDSELQIDNVPKEIKQEPIYSSKEPKHSSLESIEEVSFGSNSEKEKDDSFNINQLRKAIGVIKTKSEKEMKIESFRNALSNEIKEEGEIVTNLNLEEKLGVKLDGTPTELAEHLNMGITMDSETPKENSFILSDGRRLRSLRDLRNALEDMSDSIFSNHVYGRKNDFANWIKKIFNELELAKIVRKCKSIEVLLSMLVTLEKKEIRELIKMKEKEILLEHKESLKDLTFSNEERKELKKERELLEEDQATIEKLRKEFNDKLKVLESREFEVSKESQQAKLDLEMEKEKESKLKEQKQGYLELIKSESGSLNKLRDEILTETENHQQNLNQEFLNRKKQLEREYQIKLGRLKFDREQFGKEQIEADTLYHTKLKEVRIEEEKIYTLQRELKEQELRMLEKENRIRETLSQLSKKLIESKDMDLKLETDINKKNNLLLEIKQNQAELEHRKIDLEKEGFQSYIDEELKNIATPHEERITISPTNEDITLLYHLIDACKKLMAAGKIHEAKTAYKGVRETYYSLNLSKGDEELIFNAIRELYADIKLNLM